MRPKAMLKTTKKAQYLGQNEERSRIDTHDFKCVYLLCYTHGSNLGCDVTAHLATEDKTHDTAGEFQKHNLSGGITRHKGWHPGALDIQLDLDTNNRTNEKADEQDNSDGINSKLRHFFDVLSEKHTPPFRNAEHLSHELQISAKSGKKLL